MSENEKDSPTANDCTSLLLVDDAEGESASLLAENLSCGVEPRDCHEGTCSAAPVAQNEFSSKEAIANQTQEEVEQSNSASLRDAARTLSGENKVSGFEPRDCDEGTYSAAPIAQNEFSLNSAMPAAGVAIANQTPELVEQGQSALLLGENQVSRDEDKANHEGDCSAAPVENLEKWSHEAIVARANARPERMQKLKVAANSGQNPGFEFLHKCWDDPALQIVIKKLLAKFLQWGIAIVDGVLMKWNE
ncbi:MAG: hypothetical protein V7K69_00640 [Nostoc sp.]|uniref:hypothetical protein n=1 Tax=Nostoc sp. TaxID=1180 RepID=UPI002FFA1FAD